MSVRSPLLNPSYAAASNGLLVEPSPVGKAEKWHIAMVLRQSSFLDSLAQE